MNNIIIAKYNEDITWCQKIQQFKPFIISKGDKSTTTHMELPNIGRESHSYLTYILQNYDVMQKGDWFCFCQGNPFPHCPTFNEDVNNFNFSVNFLPLGKKHTTIKDNCPSHDVLRVSYFDNKLPFKIPPTWDFYEGGQFIVSSCAILKYPLSMYASLLDSHLDNVYTPWCLERLWPLIFKNDS